MNSTGGSGGRAGGGSSGGTSGGSESRREGGGSGDGSRGTVIKIESALFSNNRDRDSTYTDEAPATADEARVAAPDAAEEAADDLRAREDWYAIVSKSESAYTRAVPEAAAEEAPEAAGAPPAAPEAAGQLVVAPAVTETLGTII